MDWHKRYTKEQKLCTLFEIQIACPGDSFTCLGCKYIYAQLTLARDARAINSGTDCPSLRSRNRRCYSTAFDRSYYPTIFSRQLMMMHTTTSRSSHAVQLPQPQPCLKAAIQHELCPHRAAPCPRSQRRGPGRSAERPRSGAWPGSAREKPGGVHHRSALWRRASQRRPRPYPRAVLQY